MTTDHMELRKATEEKIFTPSQEYIRVSRIDLAELLAAYDALMSSGVKKSAKSGTYTPEFEEAWDAYPARPGNSKAAAFKAWKARLSSGWKPQDMIEGTIKYAAYCKAKGTEPEFVKQAATFFGPGEHFNADWTERRVLGIARRPLPAPEPEQDRAARRARWGLPGDDSSEVSHG